MPTCGDTGHGRDFGIACQSRGLGRRSGRSTQLLRVMPETWGRAAGLWRCPRLCGGCCEKQSRQTTLQVWRAVCMETCKHRFGKGRLETCRKATRWPPTSLTSRKVAGISGVNRMIFHGINRPNAERYVKLGHGGTSLTAYFVVWYPDGSTRRISKEARLNNETI